MLWKVNQIYREKSGLGVYPSLGILLTFAPRNSESTSLSHCCVSGWGVGEGCCASDARLAVMEIKANIIHRSVEITRDEYSTFFRLLSLDVTCSYNSLFVRMSTVDTVRSADLQVSKRNFFAVNLVGNL